MANINVTLNCTNASSGTPTTVTQAVTVGDTITVTVASARGETSGTWARGGTPTACSSTPTSGSLGTTFVISGFTAGSNYTVNITGTSSPGTGSLVGYGRVTGSVAALAVPTTPTATYASTTTTTTTVTMSTTGFTGNFQFSTNGGTSWLGVGVNTFTATAGTAYPIVARSNNGGSVSAASGTLNYTVPVADVSCSLTTTPSRVGGEIIVAWNYSGTVTGVLSGCTASQSYRFQNATNSTAAQTGATSLNFTYTIPSTPGTSLVYQAQVSTDSGSTWLNCTNPPSFTITRAPSPVSPEISSVTVGTEAAASATVTINNNGGGGNYSSIEYAAGTTNPPTNWQASNVFSLARSSSTYYAQIRVDGGADTSTVSSFTVPFLVPDRNLDTLTVGGSSVTSLTINNATTSVAVAWSGVDAIDWYRLFNTSTSTNAIASTEGGTGGDITGQLPPTGSTYTYVVQARKQTEDGGNNVNGDCTVAGSPFNGGTATFTITRTADVTPDPLNFTDVPDATPSTVYTTYIQITGIEAAVSVSRTSGTALFSVSATTTPGTFGSTATTISNGQYLHLQITSSPTASASLSTVMNVGGVTDTWTVTTIGIPAAPTNITVTTDATSTQTATVTVAVTGSIGTTYYQINSGTWQTSNSFSGLTRQQSYSFGVKNNNGFFDSTTYSENYAPTYNVVDTSIEVSPSSVVNGTIPSTATDTANKTVSYTNASVGSSYYLIKDGTTDVGVTTVSTGNSGGTWTLAYVDNELPVNGATSTYTVEAICTVANGGQGGSRVAVTGTNIPFTITRAAADTTPESYTNLAGNVAAASLNTNYYATFSTTTAGTTSPGTGKTLNDIDTAVTVSVSNGQYSTDGTNWTPTSASVAVGATVYYRGTSSPTPGTQLTHSLTIGTVTRSFTTTTIAADTTPEGYTALAGNVSTANTSTYYYATFSATVAGLTSPGTGKTLNDINTSITATPTNGEYSTNGTTWLNTAGSVAVGATVYFRGLSSPSTGTQLTHTLQLGTVSRSFTTTTTSSTNLNIGTVSRTPSGDLTGAYASTVVVNFTGVANHRYKITRTSGTVTDVVTAASLGVSTLTIPSGTSLPSEGTTSAYQIYVRLETAQGGDNIWYPANSGNFGIVRIQQPTVIDNQTFDTTTNSSTISHSIQLKTEGYGGTKQYAISTSPTYNTNLIGTWQTSPTFTLTRTSSYYFWARRSTDAGDADGSSLQTVPVYTEPNLYGVRVYASNGTTILLDVSSRIGRAITKGGPLTVAANSTSAAIPVSLGTSDNSHVVVLFPDTDSLSPFTVNTNYAGDSFTITNTSSTSISNIYYYVLNSGEVI